MESRRKILEQVLKDNEYKVTDSRIMMLEFFLNNGEHYKPEDIYDLMKDQKLGLATIYRNLDIFRKLGIIRSIAFDNKQYYELNMFSNKKLHLHFYCKSCKTIIESKDSEIVQSLLKQKDFVENSYESIVDEISIVMKGICKDCRR